MLWDIQVASSQTKIGYLFWRPKAVEITFDVSLSFLEGFGITNQSNPLSCKIGLFPFESLQDFGESVNTGGFIPVHTPYTDRQRARFSLCVFSEYMRGKAQ